MHGVLRARQLGGRDGAGHDAPPVGVPALLEVGRQHPRVTDGRLTAAAAIIEGPRAFARRGPFEKSDRVGRSLLERSLVITTFSDLGVPAAFTERLSRQGITEPLTIQSDTIPPALAGRDICGKAPTGSGKTLAFGIPLAVNTEPRGPRRPRALVLVPTRELASQVHDVLGDLLGHDRKRVVAIFGGTGYRDQVRALHKGVNIVVACPGRLEDLIERGDVRLDDVSTVVLDEADRMSDMGFLPAVRRLLDQTAANRQVLLFSATIGREVESIIRSYQRDPVRVAIEATAEAKGDVAHHFWQVDRAERVAITAKLIERHGQAFVFCRTKRGADRVVRQLQAHGVRAVPMHGDRTQGQRERALDSFAKGRADALGGHGRRGPRHPRRRPARAWSTSTRRRTTSTTCTGRAARAGPGAPAPSSRSSPLNSARTCMACNARSGWSRSCWRRSRRRNRRRWPAA